jgi:hypothetical protein
MVSNRRQRSRSESKDQDESSQPVQDENPDQSEPEKEEYAEDDSKLVLPVVEKETSPSSAHKSHKHKINEEVRVRLTKAPTRLKQSNSNQKKTKNELTNLIPGYTAEMRLNTPSLDRFRSSGGIRDLQKRAERTDASTKGFVVESSRKHTDAMQKTSTGLLPTSYQAAYSSFKKGSKRVKDESAGSGWFNMQPTRMTEELKTDLAVIRNRTYLDPKKFYKSSDKSHKIVQLGTVIEGAAEYYSSRLTKKQRRSNITEEILADPSTADYATNKFKQMSRERTDRAKKSRKRGRKRR